jgi:hypothetical protein
MRMLGMGWEELTRCVYGRMNRLHGDLGRGEVPANQDVEVRNLAEGRGHERSPFPKSYPLK